MPVNKDNTPRIGLNDYNLAGPPVRTDINESLEPPVRDVHSILAERADRKLHNDIAKARAKSWLLEEARALTRQQIEAEQATAAREAYYAEMRPRLTARGLTSYETEKALAEMYTEEVKRQASGRDEATRSARAARYAI